ncbi:aggregation factor core [Sulfitobacter sp. SK012]|nr:aggregation factor core [Sulfitobacter sp. SK012]
MAFSFNEGAPKDRFTITNTGSCSIENATIMLDLSTSKSGLIFDVTGKGAGVEVFQPLVIMTGADALRTIPSVKDGDNRIELDIKQLAAGKEVSFTIDVDDTMGGREITVSGSEIEGAQVKFSQSGTSETAFFASNASGLIKVGGC